VGDMAISRRAVLWLTSVGATLAALGGRIIPHTPPAVSERNIFASLGDIVTCENGHPICAFAETVMIGQMQDVRRHFVGWTQEEPEAGSYPVCAKCEALFTDSGHFHFEDGWR
jgi:hypothetical protein